MPGNAWLYRIYSQCPSDAQRLLDIGMPRRNECVRVSPGRPLPGNTRQRLGNGWALPGSACWQCPAVAWQCQALPGNGRALPGIAWHYQATACALPGNPSDAQRLLGIGMPRRNECMRVSPRPAVARQYQATAMFASGDASFAIAFCSVCVLPGRCPAGGRQARIALAKQLPAAPMTSGGRNLTLPGRKGLSK